MLNNENSQSKMNQTIPTNYELKKSSPLPQKINRNFDFSKNLNLPIKNLKFFSNNQNVSQNLQNLPNQFQQSNNVQSQQSSKTHHQDRNLNSKVTSLSMISETHTHYKKQKIQNLMNETNLQLNQQLNYNDNKIDNFQSISPSILNQFPKISNQFNSQLNPQFNQLSHINQQQLISNYPESLSSSESTSNCSPEPNDFFQDQSYPVNLIKSNSQLINNNFYSINQFNNQDTSSSSSSTMENKDDIQQDLNPNVTCMANQMQLAQHPISDLSNKKFNIEDIKLVFTKQPAKYHRARYMTEGSRGPIRDKSGKSFPTIKLLGYNNRPCKAVCYLTDDKVSHPHLFYQASKLTSRCLTNCVEIKLANTIALQFELNPRNQMELMIDCLGIVKQRLFEIQQQQHNQEKSHFKTPYTRLVFECYIEEYNHIVKTYSDTIHCKQMMRAPEIHRMSLKECHISGDKELFIIGKNFTKDIKLYLRYENQWEEILIPVKELFHQAHLVCNVPKLDLEIMNSFGKTCTDKDGHSTKRLNVDLFAVCDNKQSGKEQFTYYM